MIDDNTIKKKIIKAKEEVPHVEKKYVTNVYQHLPKHENVKKIESLQNYEMVEKKDIMHTQGVSTPNLCNETIYNTDTISAPTIEKKKKRLKLYRLN